MIIDSEFSLGERVVKAEEIKRAIGEGISLPAVQVFVVRRIIICSGGLSYDLGTELLLQKTVNCSVNALVREKDIYEYARLFLANTLESLANEATHDKR